MKKICLFFPDDYIDSLVPSRRTSFCFQINRKGNSLIFDLSEEEVLQGCIYVKLKEEPSRRGAGKEHRQHGNDRSQGIGSGCFFFENRENGTYVSLMLASLKNVPVKRGFIYGIMSGFLKRHRPPVLLPKWLFWMVLKRLYLFLRLYPGQRRKQRGSLYGVRSGRVVVQ